MHKIISKFPKFFTLFCYTIPLLKWCSWTKNMCASLYFKNKGLKCQSMALYLVIMANKCIL